MSSAEKLGRRMSPDEYTVWERSQVERHEYYQGEVFSQAGGSRRHSQIGTNIARVIGNQLMDRDCIVHGSDMRILIEATGYQAYPDVSVVCPPFEGSTDEVISNPVLLVEVLSPSTIDFDRGTKFGHYRQIPSLREYMVVWQDEAQMEQHSRNADGLWVLREAAGLDAIIELASLSLTLALKDVYSKVSF